MLFTRVLSDCTCVLLAFTRVFKWYRLKPMLFQAVYVIQMLKPMQTATKDWREAGEKRRRAGKEERRKGGEEERRRGGEKEERRRDSLLFTRVLRAIANVLLLFARFLSGTL